MKVRRLITIIVVSTVFSFLSAQGKSITNYYYYNGNPYYLNTVNNQVFILLEKSTDRIIFDRLLSEFPEIKSGSNIDFSDGNNFVSLKNQMNDEALSDLIQRLNLRSEIVSASQVFKMPEGKGSPDVLIGVKNEIIAQFKPDITDEQIKSYMQQKGLSIIQQLSLSGGKSYVFKITKGQSAIDQANELFLSGLVNYTDPCFYYTNLLQDDPNDPFFPMQWSHRNTGNNIPSGISGTPGCDMRTDSAWIYTMGSPDVIVGMVDTGIDTLHEDLSANIIHGLSINTYSNLPYAWDDNNHGTCTAGIVAAIGNNGLGITGVAPLSRIFGIKIFNASGYTSTDAIVNGMIEVWQRGAWISSNSWGGGNPISAADNAINDGVNFGRNGKGVVWTFATHNFNTELYWPSTLPNVISVGGLSPCNQRKSLSSCDLEYWWGANYGEGLEVVAPAVKVYTTDRTGSAGYTTTNYDPEFNGTSAATPNVSGVCALMLAADSNLTWQEVRQIICETADKVGNYTYNQPGQLGLGGWNNEMGYGKINAYQAVKYVVESIPVEITTLTAKVINSEVKIEWNTATETNNRGYKIQRKFSRSPDWEDIGFVAGFGTTTEPKSYLFRDTDIKNGVYNYRLQQIDFDGKISYSNEIYIEVHLPLQFSLSQNYPNPFNPSTKIKYSIPADGYLKLTVYNTIGQQVAELVNGQIKAGPYEVTFDAKGLSSGVYFYKLQANSFTAVKKMILIR